MSVILGKVKFFPLLYNLREEHLSNESTIIPNVQDQQCLSELYAEFSDCLAAELAESSGTTLDNAKVEVEKFYGYLKHGADAMAIRKKSLKFRLRREAMRLYHQLHDLLYRDEMLQTRRRLSPTSSICRNEAWQTAYRLMVEYPDGMPDFKTK
jgi:hypothetical protein